MATARLGAISRHIRNLVADENIGGQTDGSLLRAFLDRADQAAFEALLRRHGAMVFQVCLRGLGNVHDAEDALQATFLVLARQAASIRKRESLASWLHGVASHMATHAKRAATRRSGHEARANPGRAADPALTAAWKELQLLLDQEIGRLPELLREPFIACCLENKSCAEAADQLGVEVTTVWKRLSRARKQLQERLTRRGVSLTAALAAGALAGTGVQATVPRALLSATVKAAAGAAAGHALTSGDISPSVISLVEGAKRAMALTKCKVVFSLVFCAGFIGVGLGSLQRLSAQPAAKESEPKATKTDPKPEAGPAFILDRDGNPLPAGALFRFGSTRLRHDGQISASALSPDGTTLATASHQSVVLWDLATAKPVRRWSTDGITFSNPGLAYSPDGRHLGHVKGPDFACVWELKGGTEVVRFAAGRRRVNALCGFTPDGGEFYLGDGDDQILSWDLRANKESRSVAAAGVALLTSDARTGFRVDGTGTISAVDAGTGKELQRLEGDALRDGIRNGVAISPDGKLLAVVNDHKEIRVLDFPGAKVRASFALPESAKHDVGGRTYWEYRLGFSADGTSLLLGTVGGQSHVWDLSTKKELPTLKKHVGAVTGIHVLPDRKTVVTTGADGLIRRWDRATGQENGEVAGYAGRVHAAFAPDGRFAAVGDGRGRVELWDARDGRPVGIVQRAGAAAARMCFTADGRSLAVALADGTVHFRSVPGGDERSVLRCGAEQDLSFTRGMGLSPDGKRLLLSGSNLKLRMWDVVTGKVVWGGQYGEAAFSPDGTVVVAEYLGLHVLDAATGKPRAKLPLTLGGIGSTALAFSPDSTRIAVGRHDGTVYLCRLDGTGVVTEFRAVEPRMGELEPDARARQASVEGLAFSPDGQWLCSSGNDGSVRLWEVATGYAVFRAGGHVGPAGDVAFGADGRTVVTCGADAQGYLWSLRPPAPGSAKASLDSLWAALAEDSEPAAAYQAVWRMADAGGVPGFLAGKLAPVKPVPAARLEQLIADLGSDRFAVRDAANRALAELGEVAMPAMQKALTAGPSLEQRQRLEVLVKTVQTRKLSGGELRIARAIGVLERQGTAEARGVLKHLAAGAAGAQSTTAAQAALKRLEASESRSRR